MKIILKIVLLTTLLLAQQHRFGPKNNFFDEPGKKIQMFKFQKMIEELNITDENKIKNMQNIFQPHFNNIHKLQREKRQLIDELDEAIFNNDIQHSIEITNKIMDLERKVMNNRIKYFEDMKSYLTDDEYAKFVLFEFKFQELLNNFVKNRRMNR
jgi:glucose-6-phosphate-specific signal transduction histidine kinase